MKYPVAVQLYSLREEVKKIGYLEVLKKVAGFGYPGVELAGLDDADPKEIRKALDGLGLKACALHGVFPADENIGKIVAAAQAIGYRWHVIPHMKDVMFASEDACKKTAELIQKGAEQLKKHGVGLAFHNHWSEFDKTFNGKYPLEILLENAPDLYAQVDTYWAAVAGTDVPAVVGKMSARLPLLHVKDGPLDRSQPMTAVGAGKMKWKPIIAAADPDVLEWLVVELDSCATDMFDAVSRSIRYLVANGLGRQR